MHPTTSQDISVGASQTTSDSATKSPGIDSESNQNSTSDEDMEEQNEGMIVGDGTAKDAAGAGEGPSLLRTKAYQDAKTLLENGTGTEFLAPFTSVVSLRNVVTDPPRLNTSRDGETARTSSTAGSPARSPARSPLDNPRRLDLVDYALEDIMQQNPFSRPGVLRDHHTLGRTSVSSGDSSMSSSIPSLLTPNRGHHALFRALEEFDSLEKQEAGVQLRTNLSKSLTEVVMGESYASPNNAIDDLEALSQSVPRRVCQHPFKKNDIVWVCRTCQADETCVLCHSCFKASNHEGHDVAFYHAQAGGCCDCGDPDAWDPAGFCPNHGPASLTQCIEIDDGAHQSTGPLNSAVIDRAEGVVPASVDWLVDKVAVCAEQGHKRTQDESDEELTVDTDKPSQSNDDDMSTESDARKRPATFSPSAAGSSRYRRGNSTTSTSEMKLAPSTTDETSSSEKAELPYSRSEFLGTLAREEGGLYLVLKSDDIHTLQPLVEAIRELIGRGSLFTESIIQKCVRALKQFGQLVVWGTMELLAEMSSTQIQLWLDGDRVAAGVLGSTMMKKAAVLTKRGLFCSILTRKELLLEQQAVVVLQWLTSLARSCDPLCQTVAQSISPDGHLVPLLRADFKLSSRITKYWHSLLLTLLAVPAFKSHLAAAYCDTYQDVTKEYARGMGVLERSGYALSVQFLNRVTYVVDLVQRRNLLGKLGASLYQTLNVAANDIQEVKAKGRRLDPNHFILTHRRYSPCISDLKCVLNVKGMPRLFASKYGTFLSNWIAALSLGQMMDPQVWRNWDQGHVELEVRGWVGAFNASISLGSLFERLLSWDDSDPSPIKDPSSPLSSNLMSCVGLTVHMMAAVNRWQSLEAESYEPTPVSASIEPYKRRSASLPFSTISVKAGSVLAFTALPVSQETPFSFHIPLHRFVTACLRESCLRESGVSDLRNEIANSMSDEDQRDLFVGMMEFPLLVLSRAAQVRAGLWRRNGNGLNDQVLNYAEPPFCRAMRDADLLLVQFAMLGRTRDQTTDQRPDSDSGVCFLVHLLLHRLGLFDFCGLAKAPDADVNRYLDEVQKGMYSAEKSSEEMGEALGLPSTFSPCTDAASSLLLLEEFLHTMIILCSELPPVPPSSKAEHTIQAKWRLKREVIHRLASGPKTHSELAEVHHVLSHWDNVFLSEEGKLVNPDDATGAALGAVLSEVAIRRMSRGKMEPDKWELNKDAWEMYDPSFFHINLRNHQTAAEYRPDYPSHRTYKAKPKALCPPPPPAHPMFERLRRDITADRSLIATIYRTLHIHVRDSRKKKNKSGLRGSMAYEDQALSETALARAVHLLTIGAYTWQDASSSNQQWRQNGGGSVGSLFFDRSDDEPAPTAKTWISSVLLANPRTQQSSEWFDGEESCLRLLQRLAVDGGYQGGFLAQDRAVQAGAAWLCEFAAQYNPEASRIIHANNEGDSGETKQESEAEKRKRIAKEKAMERMKAQAAKFASMMKAEFGDAEDDEASTHELTPSRDERPGVPFTRQGSFASGSSVASASDNEKMAPLVDSPDTPVSINGTCTLAPTRLMKSRPRCIICNEDTVPEPKPRHREGEGHRKSRKRSTNALALVGHAQASTVMKGGGGPPVFSPFATARRFVGGHVSLCGHAIHSECWESYLQTLSHREERMIGKRDEFRCPLCQRVSNCLVPFIDVAEDWIQPHTNPDSLETEPVKSEDCDDDTMSVDSSSSRRNEALSLQKFLTNTPWWVTRHNVDILWDGQCAFVSKPSDQDMEMEQTLESSPLVKPHRRLNIIRPLRKKDLYAAWNAMMKTPRFMKRKLRPKADEMMEDGAARIFLGAESPGVTSSSSSDSAGETVVWRRFMDQISDITYRADGKRLGDDNLHSDFGEFRHYIVEKYTYNMRNKYFGRDTSDWPSCVYSTTLTDIERQELSREKLLSKLMMSLQAFTYTVCCEVNEATRLSKLIKKELADVKSGMRSGAEQTFESVCSQFGISDIACDGKLVIMPSPDSSIDDGCQPFNGRLGRVRYLALAVMAAAGAVSSDLVQIVLGLPVASAHSGPKEPHRAPVVYPILCGHVLTHVVAAICATAGRERARKDSLDLVWPVSFSRQGSFIASEGQDSGKTYSVVDDSEGFIKLGLLARILQVMLGCLDVDGLDILSNHDAKLSVLKALEKARTAVVSGRETDARKQWNLDCILLVEMALQNDTESEINSAVPEHTENAIIDRLQDGFIVAAEAASAYLSNIVVVLQLVVPGVMTRYPSSDVSNDTTSPTTDTVDTVDTLETLSKFEKLLRFESFHQMIECSDVKEIVSNWFAVAKANAEAAKILPGEGNDRSSFDYCNLLYQTQGFRKYDWPLESCHDLGRTTPSSDESASAKLKSDDPSTTQQHSKESTTEPMDVDAEPLPSADTASAGAGAVARPTGRGSSLVNFSSKKSVDLIGGFTTDVPVTNGGPPRITMIPTSYTDLYAELGSLLPECEQTAVCLICGEVLNAGGKGECTKHSYKCGAGCGLFFLLQECAGLIMHNGKAAYIHSPYVDSHGETPQYRGRPLNLDMDRYEHLHEVWSGHVIRQQVIAERSSSRSVIVPDFY